MNLARSLTRKSESRDQLAFDEWVSWFGFGGSAYPYLNTGSLTGEKESIAATFPGYVQSAFKSNPVIFSCMLVRMLLFSEARFQFRRPNGDLFGTQALIPLEKPWENATTGDLLSRMIQDADLAGNAYVVRIGDRLFRRRPDWMTIILGGQSEDPDEAELIGYGYKPGGPAGRGDPVLYHPEQVAHFAPIPDPVARYRGVSWLDPVIREIMGDTAATSHKLRFFENGATPNLIMTMDSSVNKQSFDLWKQAFKDDNEGVTNAYKTLFLGGGASAQIVGANLRQVDFKQVQGAGETRIAAAAGVPPIIVGLSEGLQSATYSNYAQARRRFADGTIRPLWRNASASLGTLIDVPAGCSLWYDDTDIPFLQEDLLDAANVQSIQSASIHTLITAGFEPSSVITAIVSGDMHGLVHTGMYSVQLQPAGTPGAIGEGKGALEKGTLVPATPAPANGKAIAPPTPPAGALPKPDIKALLGAFVAPYIDE